LLQAAKQMNTLGKASPLLKRIVGTGHRYLPGCALTSILAIIHICQMIFKNRVLHLFSR